MTKEQIATFKCDTIPTATKGGWDSFIKFLSKGHGILLQYEFQ
jgi:hypothetical protein